MTHKGTVTLETERLILRRFTLEDAEAMFRNWACDPEVTKYMTWPIHDSVETTRKVIASWVDGYENLTKYEWAIVLRSLGEPIGSIAAMGANDNLRSVEIGYNIGKPWWGNGYTAEAMARIIQFLFEEVGLNRIVAIHEPHNPNSGAVMRKAGMMFEAFKRQAGYRKQVIYDHYEYAILAEDYFGRVQNTEEPETSIIETLKTSTDLMFHNLHIAMDTVDWNADICGAPAWRYIYHTLHSADKFFINPSSWVAEDEPPFHLHMLDWPDTPTVTVLSKETLYAYFDKVRQKIISYINTFNDIQLNERPGGKLTRLGLMLSQFRHMYAHIGILNGVTIVSTQQFTRVITEGVWRSGILPEGLYDVEERK
jgi:ribosomal-protein-alanine N-acetyltransferase